MNFVPFCVIDKPYMVWGHDLYKQNMVFLERIDTDLYFRTAHSLVASIIPTDDKEQPAGANSVSNQGRKDASSLSRLLWHHGVETLVMLLGAYMQAPGVVQGYFLKCKTEDATELGGLLLREELPKYNRLHGNRFSLLNLMLGIHASANWQGSDKSEVVNRFSEALVNMLNSYTSQHHRWEYNSIKHGLRASHGAFSLAVGVEDVPGTPARPEAMRTIGYSKDASFFSVVKSLRNATREQTKLHFTMSSVSVARSLERVLMELQLLSLLLGNTVSALRIANEAPPNTVKFSKIADDAQFWEEYGRQQHTGVPTSSFGPDIDANGLSLPTAEEIFRSYEVENTGPVPPTET